MKVHVYDTYVETEKFGEIHFDVITDKKSIDGAVAYGKKYLESIGEGSAKISSHECQFCHTQDAPEAVETAIKKDGYFIQKMQNCPK